MVSELPSRPARLHPVLLIALIAAAVAGLVAAVLRQADAPRPVRLQGTEWVADTGRYAGAASCAACHAEIATAQLASRHASTARDLRRQPPRGLFPSAKPVVDPLTGAEYRTAPAGRGWEIAVSQGGGRASQPLAYEFGSGRHAYGYLASLDPFTWLDIRLNYYTEIGGWDFTSGQDKPQAHLREQPLGRFQRGTDAARCFMCHSTVLYAHGVGKQPADGSQLRMRPDRGVLGITCEACHGPRQEHVEERRARLPVTAKPRMSADELNQLCGRCHGITNVDPAHPVIARFQPWGLEQSRCFRASAGRLSCVTCHDPHRDAVQEAGYYVAKCLDCHSGRPESVGITVCPVNPRDGCVGCHMPRDSQSMLHTTLTDHRIRVLPAASGRPTGSTRTGR